MKKSIMQEVFCGSVQAIEIGSIRAQVRSGSEWFSAASTMAWDGLITNVKLPGSKNYMFSMERTGSSLHLKHPLAWANTERSLWNYHIFSRRYQHLNFKFLKFLKLRLAVIGHKFIFYLNSSWISPSVCADKFFLLLYTLQCRSIYLDTIYYYYISLIL